ncbi:SocA family protein [Roseobacter sp. YSTF-M11]|uniref:SocA family protein n=1 Tax=Roseobacter insulae TaxID=2859783 RepID=A0A9X1FTA8_9RHOB|nr:Panacea domain-containing protein [Roseobacter insulae]MBW4707346.1 SocA family protein [Roseobacter insulae]
MNLDKEKLKNLIHTIAYATRDRDGFGRTKLYKVMWFFEAKQYTLDGVQFSGAKYVRDTNGPRLHNYERWFQELESEGRIQCFDERYYNRTIKRVKGLRPPEPGLLSESQAQSLNYWIKVVADMTAEEVSDLSHDYGWEIAEQGDFLPLSSILAERIRDPEGEELEWAKRRARELGLP